MCSIPVENVLTFALMAAVALVVDLLLIAVLARVYAPQIKEVSETFDTAKEAIKRGYSAMGIRSADIKAEKALEKDIIGDIMENYPEVDLLLEYLSPETAEKVQERPEVAIKLIERYQPYLEKLGIKFDVGEKKEKTQYDY